MNGGSWLAQVHERGVAFVRHGDPTELVHTLLEGSLRLTAADFASVWLADTDSLLVTPAESNDHDSAAMRAARKLGAAVARVALASEEDEAAALAATDSTALREALAAAGVRTVETIPLRVGDGSPLGVLGLWFRRAPATMSPSSVPAALARQVADFLDCRRTHERLTTELARTQEAGATAAAAIRRRDDFLATLSHELRQPLAATLPALEVQKRSDNPEHRQRAVEIIEQQLRQVVRLVDDLTDLSHIQRGALHLRRERVDLRMVLRQAIDATSATAVAKRQRLAVQLGAAPAWAVVDVGRMTQVFSNLLQNAGTYTPEGGEISIALSQFVGRVEITVRDDGAGIQADDLDRIFRPFERAAGRRDSPGLGIGLALVRQIIEMHGGTVSARSDGRDRGSEFVVSLPVDAGVIADADRAAGHS